jgi:predicted NUDIX family NTP pyrophosphohydrolase
MLEVFLVHPGGPYWRNKDAGAWSIPKGEVEEGADALDDGAANSRETGSRMTGELVPLTPLKQPSGKVVHAWAASGDVDASSITSNTFRIEWPPRSGKQQEFPEIDQGAWFTITAAKEKYWPANVAFSTNWRSRSTSASIGRAPDRPLADGDADVMSTSLRGRQVRCLFEPRLVNDAFGDPGLLRRFSRRTARAAVRPRRHHGLPPRKLMRLSHVFVTHTHMDHFAGFITCSASCSAQAGVVLLAGGVRRAGRAQARAYTECRIATTNW